MKRHKKTFHAYHMVAALLCSLCMAPAALALEIEAKLSWSQRVELAMPVSGVIKKVSVNAGDRVKKDTPLVELDDRAYRAAVSKARAVIKDLDEQQKEAARELERAQQLYDGTMLSQHELQMVKNAKVNADARYQAAKAELVQVQLDLEYATLRAPFDAIILQRHAELGQTVVSQLKPETLIVLAAAGRMLATGYLPQEDLEGDIRDKPAMIRVNNQSRQGRIKSIGLEPMQGGQQKTGYYEIMIEFDTDGMALRAGQKAVIELP